ncbi:hypothetical protein DL93DRAFT_159064 [Clavulina sp. PMI_390]|nr:hypothetical protein DL93DRAFT_159064 [Clavulina sp. PMI_390]
MRYGGAEADSFRLPLLALRALPSLQRQRVIDSLLLPLPLPRFLSMQAARGPEDKTQHGELNSPLPSKSTVPERLHTFYKSRTLFTMPNIVEVNQIAAAQNPPWIVEFDETRIQVDGIWQHTAILKLDGDRMTTGSGRNVMAARDAACEEWLRQKGYKIGQP